MASRKRCDGSQSSVSGKQMKGRECVSSRKEKAVLGKAKSKD